MRRNIEPGCLALVVNDPEAGIAVECIEFKAPGFEFRAAGAGTLHATREPAWTTLDPDGATSIRPARTLLRIDGHEPEVETEQQEEEIPQSA